MFSATPVRTKLPPTTVPWKRSPWLLNCDTSRHAASATIERTKPAEARRVVEIPLVVVFRIELRDGRGERSLEIEDAGERRNRLLIVVLDAHALRHRLAVVE